MKKKSLLIIPILMIIAQTSCSGLNVPIEPVSREEYLLDTICTVSVYRIQDEDEKDRDAHIMTAAVSEAIDEAFEVCANLEDKLSRTREGSEISRINSSNGAWTEVSEETLELIRLGTEYSDMTDGAFDITVGGLTDLWNFHAPEGEEALPDAKELASRAAHVNYANIETEGNKVRLKDPAARIDLGALAKGYIARQMALHLRFAGVTSGIVNLGGNVVCIGGRPGGDDFSIGIETPFSDRTRIVGKVGAKDKTLVTSGVYERKMEIDGTLYHHILNTGTGYPVETDLLSVTVIADWEMAADADALSTVCLIKGYDEAARMIEDIEGTEAVFVLSDGSIKCTSNAGFTEE